ncbi:peptide ABC transporter substrate-binding protein [Lactobacillus corticis]|uniref:Oligopeptide ABC transporter substrate-binding protein n=1 Tax=Lactobacillus corticis TaxID=2201249 RepID=A0A916QGJ0_9LACO|nr:peptide ABC transporter substrate-binding protein [Lactobacillus corticis]GFZ26906.1 oligopeptide ABC transporter substrate-binding protein [Lactobacillus corticis]
MKHRKFLLTAVVSVVALTLAACGSNNSSSAEGTSKSTLNLSAQATLDTIDISKATGFGQTGNVFESFYRLGKNGKPAPGLAQSSQVSKDGKTWTFTLRKNLKWSNGDPITAADFVYSWRRSLTPKTLSPYSYLFDGVKNASKISAGKMSPSKLGIKAEGKRKVVITLNKPISYFKVLMAYPLFGPQNEKVVKKYGKKYATNSKYMVYSGPFKITGWNGTGDTWSFVKNNNYWDKKVVKLKRINYQVVKTYSTGLNMYYQKKLDLVNLDSEQVKNLKSRSDYKVYPYSLVNYLAFNYNDTNATNKKAFNNRNIRLALSLALDRKTVANKILGDGSSVPKGFVASDLASSPINGKDFADEEYGSEVMAYNEKKAKQLWKKGLKEIGANKLTFTVLADNSQGHSDPLTQYYQSQWTKVLPGISIKIANVPSTVATSRAKNGDFDIYLGHWGADFNDPISFLQTKVSGTSYNYGGWSNKEYDALVKKAENQDANNPKARWKDMLAAEKIYMQDVGGLPIYQQSFAYLQNSKLRGVIHNTAGTQWSYKYAYFK